MLFLTMNMRNYILTLMSPSLSVAVFAVSHYGGKLLLTYFFSGYYKGRDDWPRLTTQSKTDRISLRRPCSVFLSRMALDASPSTYRTTLSLNFHPRWPSCLFSEPVCLSGPDKHWQQGVRSRYCYPTGSYRSWFTAWALLSRRLQRICP